MQKIKLSLSIIILFISCSFNSNAQRNPNKDKKTENIYDGLKFRHLGPALMSGRISDIAIHPNNENIWYVASGSGGAWKTENSGTTWKPIFDNEKSYSIGCITLDPQNSDIVWIGSGENVGGRHVAYGDGIYKSVNGGKNWQNMGLKKSEHISKIIVHPTNQNTIWVASQGPLWSKGGERGIFKSTDGGKSWIQKLGDDEWIGATDLIIDPRDPKILYAATWQRHRTVAGYMGGGPGSNIYKSIDGGDTWKKIDKGLPKSNMGKIGLAISPQNPDVLYAAIELNRRSGGVFKSSNRGESWSKMSDAVSGGTGPHYYQELYASPHNFDEIYLADNYMQVSFDGGKTFSRMNESEKHVDNHAVAFKKDDPNYILVGCDGGLYESFDKTKNWKFIDNLPLTQFYKIAVDNAYPFYYVYGGTQDNNTQGAPSRTDNIHGIRNSDWFILLGGDGHQPATDPNDPNIVYVQWQRGNLNRHDRITGENINIKPQPKIGEKIDRFNWDSPILVSSHNSKTLYFASQRLWKSEDRGDSWTAISKDLTNNIERIQTPFFGSKQKWDNAWDLYAMSNYSTITSISESPKNSELIYIGTDDGIIQVTEDGGKNWRKTDFSKIIDLPNTSFVNDIKADLYDENIVYAVFDNHKYGDFKPYVFKSINKGKTWKKISSNLPENTILWRIVQDHVDNQLMFLGSEFGVYFTNNQGQTWNKLKNGMPNISVRDLAIQKRENDLVVGTFGRGIYVLDDYSSLREFKKENVSEEIVLFTPKNAFWYTEKRILGSRRKAAQGDNFYLADNPPYGVNFTYYQANKYKSKKEIRLNQEKELEKNKKEVSTPTWNLLESEKNELTPSVWAFIYSQDGKIVKKVKAINKSGFNRISWDLTSESKNIITKDNFENSSRGNLIAPDEYSAQMFKQIEGKYIAVSNKVKFNVVPLKQGALKGSPYNVVVSHWNEVSELRSKIYHLSKQIKDLKNKSLIALKAYQRAELVDEKINMKILSLREKILELELNVNGSSIKSKVGEQNDYPRMRDYIWAASSYSTYGPTKQHKESLQNAHTLYNKFNKEYESLNQQIKPINNSLNKINAPVIK
ncbi:MAG: glycosyl hydrolase [Flavobacteriales bacterium]|nr:glycosyl hydrolase [Flavobacteriales bacterium]